MRPKLVYVQILRALAACAVVFLHANMVAQRFAVGSVPSALAEFGRYGVDLFFVISGFVIYYVNHPRPMAAGDFTWRRLRRIVPLYWLMTLAAFALWHLMPARTFQNAAPEISQLAVSLAFLSLHHPIIGAGWTLEFEMLFYVATAIALAIAPARWTVVVYVLVGMSVAGQVFSGTLGPLAVVMTPLLLEFVFGVMAARLLLNGQLPVAQVVVIALGVAVAIMAGWVDAMTVALAMSVLVYWAARLSLRKAPSGRSFGVRVAAALGDASYSIYLIQFFTLAAVGRWVQVVETLQPVTLPLAFFTTVAAGWLCYALVERPIFGRRASPLPAKAELSRN